MKVDDNRQVISRLYASFAAHDGAAMAGLYRSDAVFSDPVFGELNGAQVGDMWQMLLSAADDLTVQAGTIDADDSGGTARWTADYSYGSARRPVHNEVLARFEIDAGLIATHHDTFSFPSWAGQALGLPGRLFGWTPFLKRSVRAKVRSQLQRYSARS
ncbi:MAG: nuclear transport factor 2 family protein [Acidimicrobiia bacterium]